MTKEAALHSFFSSFDLAAYPDVSVPTGKDAPSFPYLTYGVSTDYFDSEVQIPVSLWYHSSSWLDANAKAEEIGDTIGRSGKIIKCDGGVIWLKRGTPFAQSMGDETNNMIKRKYINLTAEFLTAD